MSSRLPNSLLLGVVYTIAFSVSVHGVAQENPFLGLDAAINAAIAEDDWLQVNRQQELAGREIATASGELPDPRISIGISNLPTDTFSFNQEAMTQFRVGLNQMFPPGQTLRLQHLQQIQRSDINPLLRQNRKAMLRAEVTSLWLESFLAERTISLINEDRELFEQLVDIATARYTSAAAQARQQDVVRAELELIRLEDRLTQLRQQKDRAKQQLAEWIPYELLQRPFSLGLPVLLAPTIQLSSLQQAADLFMHHPRVKAHDKQIDVANTQVELTEQSFKPSFSVGASYSYRDYSISGNRRPDFISLELSFDLPLFTENRQKPRLRASVYQAEAEKTNRILIIKELFADYQTAKAQLVPLDQRRALFNNSLLSQLSNLTEATLTSYTADEGDFAEVMRAYISELNAKIELLIIDVERLKIISRMNYLLTTSEDENVVGETQ